MAKVEEEENIGEILPPPKISRKRVRLTEPQVEEEIKETRALSKILQERRKLLKCR